MSHTPFGVLQKLKILIFFVTGFATDPLNTDPLKFKNHYYEKQVPYYFFKIHGWRL